MSSNLPTKHITAPDLPARMAAKIRDLRAGLDAK